MNLLVKGKISRLLMVAITVSFLGCREDIGIELPPDVQRTEMKYAEFDLDMTSVYLDSLRTDELGIVQAGVFNETKLGKVEAVGYTEFIFSNGFVLNDFIWVRETGRSDSLADITFDNFKVTLRIKEVLTDEFFINQQLELWSLTDSIFANAVYLSDRTIGQDRMVGSTTVNIPNLNPIDFEEDTVVTKIMLDQAYGDDFVDEFKKYGVNFRPLGLALKASNGNQIVAYDLLADTSELVLTVKANVYDTLGFATLTGDTLITTTFRFSSSNHFTNIKRDRSGSSIAAAVDKQIIDADANFAYLSPTVGIYPKIELDEFREFAEMESNILFNRVEMSYETEEFIEHVVPIEAVLYYLTRDVNNSISVNWPGVLSFPSRFNVLMQSDASITRSKDIPEYHFLDSTAQNTIGYRGLPTLFFQYHYNNIRDDLDNVKNENRAIVQQWMLDIDDLLIKNVQGFPAGRQSFPKNSLKLRLYYSQKK